MNLPLVLMQSAFFLVGRHFRADRWTLDFPLGVNNQISLIGGFGVGLANLVCIGWSRCVAADVSVGGGSAGERRGCKSEVFTEVTAALAENLSSRVGAMTWNQLLAELYFSSFLPSVISRS